jgi:hypothetical protein
VSGRCSPTEAVNLLRAAFNPPTACRKLTQAVHDFIKCRVYCDGTMVPPNFAVRLMVEPKYDDKEWRWSANIVSAVNEAWERGSYRWEFDVDEVLALLPPRRGRKGGNWKIHATLEMERLGRKAALDLHNLGELRTHLRAVLARDCVHVPKGNKEFDEVIRAFLRGGN